MTEEKEKSRGLKKKINITSIDLERIRYLFLLYGAIFKNLATSQFPTDQQAIILDILYFYKHSTSKLININYLNFQSSDKST